MNWVGETLAPAPAAAAPATPNVDKLMETYQNPQYVIDLARADYDLVINVKAQGVREKALEYSKTATLIDEQRIPEFAAMLPGLFPKIESNDTKQLKEFLLKDFGAVSFADLALNGVKDRAHQLLLLETALKYEPDFKVTGLATKREIFERILKETTAATDPLDTRAVKLALDKLKTGKKDDLADLIGLNNGAPQTPFERMIERFKGSVAAVRTAIENLLDGISENPDNAQDKLVDFMDAVERKDARALGNVLDRLAQGQGGHKFMALWELSHAPGSAPLVAQLTATTKSPAELSTLMDKALSAGILDALKINSNAATGSQANVMAFLDAQVLKTPGDFSLPVARRLIANSFANGGLDGLRKQLTAPGGWLERVVTAPLPYDGKLNWVAALLEPFRSDAAKANVLFEAASAKGAAPAAVKILTDLEANFAGDSLRLDDGKIMTNLGRIANVWYNAETRAMRYTVNGTGQTFMESLSPAEAREILTLLQRKGGFQAEYDGVYRPENIDRITSDQNGTKVTWNRHTGELNVDQVARDALHQRDDFAHITGKNGVTLSINQRSIALLQPLSDGTHLLVDRYGAVQIVDGAVTLNAKEPLLDLSGTWFNPQNASILQLNAEKNTLEFRCESNDFDELLESAVPGQYFYSVELAAKSDYATLEKAIAGTDAILAPGGKTLQNLYFNFSQLGYLMFTDGRETGFTCRKHGPTKKQGFISAEDDLAKGIFAGLSTNKDLISVENVITHKSCVDDAYYNSENGHIYVLIRNDLLQIPCPEKDAYKVLKNLSAQEGFTVVGEAPAGPRGADMPADVVNMAHASMLFFSPAQDRTIVVTDDRNVPIGLDAAQAKDLFDLIEKDGLENARKTAAAWTQGLKDSLQALPPEQITMKPSLTELSRDYLLKQITGAQTESRSIPEPQADFSIAARKLETNDNFTYPVKDKQVAAAAKRAPKP